MPNCDKINVMKNEIKTILNEQPVDYNKLKILLNKYNIKNDNIKEVQDKCNNSTISLGFNYIGTPEGCDEAIEQTCNNLFSNNDAFIACAKQLAPKINNNVMINTNKVTNNCNITNLLNQFKNFEDQNTLNMTLSLYQLLGGENNEINCENLSTHLDSVTKLKNINTCINETYTLQENVIETCGISENNLLSNINNTINDCVIKNSDKTTSPPLKSPPLKSPPLISPPLTSPPLTSPPLTSPLPDYIQIMISLFSIGLCIFILSLIFMSI